MIWELDDLCTWDRRLVKRLLGKDPETYQASYCYLYGGSSYNPRISFELLQNPKKLVSVR